MSGADQRDLDRKALEALVVAIDLINRYRPDAQAEIKVVLKDLIRNEPGLELDRTGKTMVNFAKSEWDRPVLLTASGWTRSRRVLLFEFQNSTNSLDLKLFIGPGPEETRQKLFDMAQANPAIFEIPRELAGKYNTIFSRSLLKKEMYENTDHEEREREIRRRWSEFLEEDLPQIEAALKDERWIWQEPNGADNTVG